MYYDRALRLKERLAKGERVAGVWIHLPSAATYELIADGGFDWAIIDCEHVAFSEDLLLNIHMATKHSETVPVVRVPENNPIIVKKVLDIGYEGVILPSVGSVEDVKRAIAACRYPPEGIRGFGPIRACAYGDQKEYYKRANDAIICVIQIEGMGAVEKIDEICQMKGFDWVMTGPNDLSGSAGCFLDTGCEKMTQALDKVHAAARKAGLPIVGGGYDKASMEKAIKDGAQAVFIGEDVYFIQQGMKNALETFRSL